MSLRDWLTSDDPVLRGHAEHAASRGLLDPSPPAAQPHAGRAIAPPLDPWRIVTADQLARDTLALAAELPPDLDLVCAVSRSGLLPGGLIASALHLPLWTVSARHGLSNPGHGGRISPDHADLKSVLPEPDPRHVLIIDDTAARGSEMWHCNNHVRARWPGATVTRAVIYCHPLVVPGVDLYHSLYPGSHYLAWNWPNAGHGEGCGYDFDGILTEEWYEGRDDRTARPLCLPRRRPIPLIVTAREEGRRADSEAWLARYGLRCDRLVMRDWEVKDDFQTEVGIWKGETIKGTSISLFAESDPYQAELINRISGKPVLCPALGRVLPPRPIAGTATPRKPCCH